MTEWWHSLSIPFKVGVGFFAVAGVLAICSVAFGLIARCCRFIARSCDRWRQKTDAGTKPPSMGESAQSHAQGAEWIQVGGLYAWKDKSGCWRVAKVLALDEFAVHLRSYANRFSESPNDIDPAELSLAGPTGFGIGHVPVARDGFGRHSYALIKIAPVTEDELDGYRLYLESMKKG
jgi:hypothetical protein